MNPAPSTPLFSAVIRQHAREHPERTAIWFNGDSLDYRALLADAEAIAGGLAGDGIEPGSRVVIMARPSLDYCRAIVGILLARCAVVPLPSSLPGDALAALLADAGPGLIFTDRSGNAALDAVGQRATRIGIGDAAADAGALNAWMVRPPLPVPLAEQAASDLFSIIYSSGTTGVPKGIAHDALTRSRFFALGASGGGVRTLLSTALYTNASFCTLAGTLHLGGACYIQEKFDAEAFIALVERERIERCFLVPAQIKRILAEPGFSADRLRSLRGTVMSGSPCALDLKRELAARWPGDLVENYGLSEGGILTTLNYTQSPDKLDTVGKPLPDYEMAIIDDEGKLLPAGAAGEIVGRSPYMMRDYFNRDDLTQTIAWRDAAGRLFQRTGDVGWVDADGYLHISDRKKDIIISGGMNLHASEIDHLLETHPDVAEAAVVAGPSARWGETPVAFVVRRIGAGIEAGDLLVWANARLAREMRVSAIELVDALPRNAMGKVVKRELRDRLWRAVSAAR